jgi:hypothetical protein
VKRPDKRVFCPQCGTMRICHRGSRYAVCPNGHGRLVRRFTKAQARQALIASLPRARRVGRNLFKIHGHPGLFGYRDGSGRRPARPGMPLGPDEVIARHVIGRRLLIRVFARNFRPAASGGDGIS